MTENKAVSKKEPAKALEAAEFTSGIIAGLGAAKDMEAAFADALRKFGEFFRAERVFIFERAERTMSNTVEWCADGVRPKIADFQNLPSTCFIPLLDSFLENEDATGDVLDLRKPFDPTLSLLLGRYNITNFGSAPITSEGELLGFIGAENIDEEMFPYITDSCRVLGVVMGGMLCRRDLRKSGNSCGDSADHVLLAETDCAVLACIASSLKCISANDAARKIAGLRRNDDISSALDIISDLIADTAEKNTFIDKLSAGDETKQTIRLKNGTYLSVTIKPVVLNDSRCVMLTMTDVTEVSLRAELLDKKCRSYREAISTGSEFSFAFDLTEGMIYEGFTTAHGVNIFEQVGVQLPARYEDVIGKYLEKANLEILVGNRKQNFTIQGHIDAFNSGITNLVMEYYSPRTKVYTRVNTLMYVDDVTGHIRAFASAFDVSEEYRAEQQKKQELSDTNAQLSRLNSEMADRLDVLLDGIAGGVKIGEAVGNELIMTYISEGAAQLLGYSVEEYKRRFGMDVKAGMIGDTSKYVRDALEQVREKGEYVVKYPVLHRDGSVRWIMDRGKRTKDSSSDKRIYNILVQDITESEVHAEQVKDILTMQKHMVEFLGSGIFAYTIPDRKVLIVNHEASKIFDISTEETYASGFDVMSRVVPGDKETVVDAVRRLVKPGDTTEYVFHSLKKDGRLACYRCNTKLLSFSSGQQYIISAITDITEQEAMEQRLSEEREMYREALFIGSVAFFTVDITDGIMRENVFSREGRDAAVEMDLKFPVHYDDMVRKWLNDNEIVKNPEIAEMIGSRRSMLTAYKQGRRVIETEYIYKPMGKKYRCIVMLFKVNDHVHASFISFDIK